MYETFYGLKEKPFSLLPDPAFLYLSRQHEMAITLLEYSLENQAGFCVITGKAGTGKTTLLRRLLNQIGDDVAIGLITNTHHSFGELLRWILHAFDLDAGGDNRARQHQVFTDYLIGQYAKNRRTMLIIDEAQNMSAAALEELRMLSNINSEKDLLLQVILVGQPPLRELLQHPALEQFAQRVAVDYHLDGLSSEETRGYIRHRLRVAGGEHELFTDDACDAVFVHSGGIPRLINLLCDLALVYAYAAQAAVVTGEIIEQIVSEREQHGALPVFAAGPESRTVQRLSLKQAHASAAISMSEAVAMQGARHAAAPRLVGEASRVLDTEENVVVSRSGTDAAKARVRAVKSVPAREEQTPGAIPEPNAPMTSPAATASREAAVADDAEIVPAPVMVADPQRDAHKANRISDTLPVPLMPGPARRAAADRRVRVWRYIAAGVLVLLISAAVSAWRFLDRPDLALTAPNGTSPARVTATTQTPGLVPADVAPASAPFPATQPVPAASPVPQAVAASPAPGKDAAGMARLNQIQRERDAALAAAEATVREREALQRAAQARERALAAEHEAALARERERAKQLAQAAELALLQAHEAELAAAAKAAEPAAPVPEAKVSEVPAVIQARDSVVSSQGASVEAAAEISDAKAAAAFTTNPCKGPSARFLSTCE
ncbi:MAG TPA: AAA family ATPase [Sulfuricaulis sp.]|nr:AAA family ATPase [Sulfuricaulis sp.]